MGRSAAIALRIDGRARKRSVLPDDFPNEEGEDLLGEVWVELAVSGEKPETADLLGFSFWIPQRQPVPRLQFSDCAGTPEPLCQYVHDSGIEIIDAIPEVAEARQNGIR